MSALDYESGCDRVMNFLVSVSSCNKPIHDTVLVLKLKYRVFSCISTVQRK